MAFSLSACVVGKKPQTVSAAPMAPKPVSPPTPEPPPGPLSMPQTVQELPPAQPLSNEAIASTESPEETPTIPVPRNTKPARSGQNRIAASRTAEPVGPPTPAVPPVQPPAESEPRPQIQEIVPAAELKRLQGEADKTKQEIRQRLQQIGRRHLSPKDQETKNGALSYLRESDEAEKLGDMRKAFELASRGLLLVKLLTDGR
jgi:hypothetical protein